MANLNGMYNETLSTLLRQYFIIYSPANKLELQMEWYNVNTAVHADLATVPIN